MNKWISVNERLPERELLERMHRFPKISLLMAKYDVFNEDGVPHRLTAHENGTNVFLEARKCIRRLMAKEGFPVDEYDLRIKFPGKDF